MLQTNIQKANNHSIYNTYRHITINKYMRKLVGNNPYILSFHNILLPGPIVSRRSFDIHTHIIQKRVYFVYITFEEYDNFPVVEFCPTE